MLNYCSHIPREHGNKGWVVLRRIGAYCGSTGFQKSTERMHWLVRQQTTCDNTMGNVYKARYMPALFPLSPLRSSHHRPQWRRRLGATRRGVVGGMKRLFAMDSQQPDQHPLRWRRRLGAA